MRARCPAAPKGGACNANGECQKHCTEEAVTEVGVVSCCKMLIGPETANSCPQQLDGRCVSDKTPPYALPKDEDALKPPAPPTDKDLGTDSKLNQSPLTDKEVESIVDKAFKEVCPTCKGTGVNPPNSPFTDKEFNDLARDAVKRLQDYSKYWGVEDSKLPPSLSADDRDLYSALNRNLKLLQPDIRPIVDFDDPRDYIYALTSPFDPPPTTFLSPQPGVDYAGRTGPPGVVSSAVEAARAAALRAAQALGLTPGPQSDLTGFVDPELGQSIASDSIAETLEALSSPDVPLFTPGSVDAHLAALAAESGVQLVDTSADTSLLGNFTSVGLDVNPQVDRGIDDIIGQFRGLTGDPMVGSVFSLSIPPDGGCGAQCIVAIYLPGDAEGPMAFSVTSGSAYSGDPFNTVHTISLNADLVAEANWASLYTDATEYLPAATLASMSDSTVVSPVVTATPNVLDVTSVSLAGSADTGGIAVIPPDVSQPVSIAPVPSTGFRSPDLPAPFSLASYTTGIFTNAISWSFPSLGVLWSLW